MLFDCSEYSFKVFKMYILQYDRLILNNLSFSVYLHILFFICYNKIYLFWFLL